MIEEDDRKQAGQRQFQEQGGKAGEGDAGQQRALDPAYDAGRLAGDAMALLTADAPVIVRMETLRGAVLCSRKDPRTARELQSRLSAHLQVAEENGKIDVLALFDLGYFVDACKQADWLAWDPFVELNGYALVRRALRAGGVNPEIEFAAALMLAEPTGQIFFTRHLKFAIAQATEGSLVGRNLVIHFADRGKTLTELKAAKVPRM